ncbi:MAG: SAM-dependent methyltransferase [Bdellovibrionales bacterium]|nr:SAM-dependent methyltransferase [Bdellovibrionales bacterium]
MPEKLDLEIGCGVGLHPLRRAQEYPDRTLLAVERTREKFRKFQGRLARHPEIRNLIPIHGCGIAWAAHLLPPDSVEEIFLLYPNPYPKRSQCNLRWHRMPALALFREILKPGGRITLATNEEWYFREAMEWLTQRWSLQIVAAETVALPPRTHFEKKYLARGEQCWNLVVSKPC